MEHRRIGELMTRDVVTVRLGTPFKEIARALTDNGVSAVPVLDEAGRPAGLVSEADLLRKAAGRPDPSGLTPLPRFEAWERARAEGSTAEEIMSAPVICARPEWTVVEAARLMAVQNVKRLPVVDEADRLLGIVSRRDLLRVFLRQDHAIREEISHDVLAGTLGLAPGAVTADVKEGQVTLRGTVAERRLIPVLVRLCAGVVSVTPELTHPAGATSGARGGGARS